MHVEMKQTISTNLLHHIGLHPIDLGLNCVKIIDKATHRLIRSVELYIDTIHIARLHTNII
jgi:hypothetical protein